MKKNLLMALFDPLERLITEHGSAAIQEKHIALLTCELAILKDKFLLLATENETLEAENKALKAENMHLKTQIAKIEEQNDPEGDPCPYCRQPKGRLMDIKTDPVFGDVGLKVGFYDCTGCGKQYDKEHK